MGMFDFLYKKDDNEIPKGIKEAGEAQSSFTPSFSLNDKFVAYSSTNQNATPVVSMPGNLSDADRIKWKTFFENLWAKLDDPRPSYNEFIAVCDGMGNALADNIKFPSVFQGFKAGGLTKTVLLDTAEHMLGAMVQNAQDFKSTIDKAMQTEVLSVEAEINKLQQQVVELQKQIGEKQTTALLTKQKLDANVAGYSQYSAEIQNKIKKDIENIKLLIPD